MPLVVLMVLMMVMAIAVVASVPLTYIEHSIPVNVPTLGKHRR